MAETQEQKDELTGLHRWEMGDIITTKKLNAIVNKISDNTRTINGNVTLLTEHTSKLTALENQTTGISHTDNLTTIDNNVTVNGNLNLVSATNNNLVTITRQESNSQTNLLQIAPSAITLGIPATITGKVTINSPVQFGDDDLVTKSAAQTLINTTIENSIKQLNVEQVSCDEFEIFGAISEANGKISVTTRAIPFAATDNNGGYMSTAHVTALDASAQKVSYTPITMDTDGTIVTAASTTKNASSHKIALGNVVTSLANVASQVEVSALSKDINGDYIDPDNHIVGLKDIIWGREATQDTPAIVGIVEDIKKLSPLENLPTTIGRYVLEVTMDENDNPVISWVPLENNGGEST